jgi:PAS domain S-box-containing protein
LAILFALLIIPGLAFPIFATSDKDVQVKELKVKKQLLIYDNFKVDALNTLSAKNLDSLPQLGFDLATRALQLSKLFKYKRGEASSDNNLGLYYYKGKRYLEAVSYFFAGLNIAESNHYDDLISESNLGMGLVSMDLGRRDQALEYMKKAMLYNIKKNNIERLVGDYVLIGQFLYEKGDTNGALRQYFNALALKSKVTNPISREWIMKSIGNLYLWTKKYDIALFYYREALNENQMDTGSLNGTVYSLIAHTYKQKKDLDNAILYEKIALLKRKQEKLPELIASSLINIGHIYLEQGNYDSSIYYLQSGLKDANLLKINYLKASGYKHLFSLYLVRKDWKNALQALQENNEAEVQMERERNREQIILLENNRVVGEKEKQVENLQSENAIQKLEMKNRDLLVLLLISLSLLMIAIVIYIQQLLIRNKKAKKIVEEINDQLHEEIKEQVVQNEELSKREQEYRFIADHTADMVILRDSNSNCIYVSPSIEFFLGYNPEEIIGTSNYVDFIHPDSRASFDSDFKMMMEYHEASRLIYQLVKKDGNTIWVESNMNPIFDSNTGKLQAILSVTRDVSDHINQEEALIETARQKEILIREVHHRVKNNLAILASLVNMQKSEVKDRKTIDIFSDLQFRVKAMSLVHEELYKNRNIEVLPIGEYLSKLVGIVSSAFTNNNVKIHQDFYDEIVDVGITLPLGLIVNELLTNAYKYAFPDNREGNIWVSYVKAPQMDHCESEMRCLTVRDDGIGLPSDFDISKKTSMGSQIIKLLAQQLEAELLIDGRKGANFSLLLSTKR